jgi:hypothetical protein
MATVFNVRWNPTRRRWTCASGSAVVTMSRLRTAAIDDAHIMAAALWKEHGEPAKVRVYSRSGKEIEERSYAAHGEGSHD